jgi:hypothetical protein
VSGRIAFGTGGDAGFGWEQIGRLGHLPEERRCERLLPGLQARTAGLPQEPFERALQVSRIQAAQESWQVFARHHHVPVAAPGRGKGERGVRPGGDDRRDTDAADPALADQ